ncbi:MAG: hypothetical protein ACKVP0_14960 [Pirellulaceae bacterium]
MWTVESAKDLGIYDFEPNMVEAAQILSKYMKEGGKKVAGTAPKELKNLPTQQRDSFLAELEKTSRTEANLNAWKNFWNAWKINLLPKVRGKTTAEYKAVLERAFQQSALEAVDWGRKLEEEHDRSNAGAGGGTAPYVASIIETLSARDKFSKAKERVATVSLAQMLGFGVLVFTVIVIVVQWHIMIRREQRWNGATFRLIGLTLILNAGVFLTVVDVVDPETRNPMFGLLGALAGYILGRDVSSEKRRKKVRQTGDAIVAPGTVSPGGAPLAGTNLTDGGSTPINGGLPINSSAGSG